MSVINFLVRKKCFVFLATFALALSGPLTAQLGFSMDFDSTLGFAASQGDYTAQGKVDIKADIDFFLEGRNDLGTITNALYYHLGGNVSYSRYTDVQGNLKELALELALGESMPVQFNALLGRQSFSDPTAKLVVQSLDGFNLLLTTENLSATIGGGYLGLFPASDSNIHLTPEEVADKDNKEWGTAPQRFLILSDLSFQLVPTISLGLHLGSQIDTRPNPTDYSYSSWYAGLHSSGFIFELLEYSVQATISGGHFSNQDAPAIGMLFSNHWTFTFPGTGVGRIRAGIDLSTGGDDGGFRSISSLQQGEYFLGDINQIVAPSWQIEWEPLATSELIWARDLKIYVKGKHFVDTAPTARTVGQLTSDTDTRVFGHEISLGFKVSPLSDFGIDGIIGGFLDAQNTVLFFSKMYVYIKL